MTPGMRTSPSLYASPVITYLTNQRPETIERFPSPVLVRFDDLRVLDDVLGAMFPARVWQVTYNEEDVRNPTTSGSVEQVVAALSRDDREPTALQVVAGPDSQVQSLGLFFKTTEQVAIVQKEMIHIDYTRIFESIRSRLEKMEKSATRYKISNTLTKFLIKLGASVASTSINIDKDEILDIVVPHIYVYWDWGPSSERRKVVRRNTGALFSHLFAFALGVAASLVASFIYEGFKAGAGQ